MKKLLLLTVFCTLFTPVWADMMPLPKADFLLIYNTEEKPLLDPLHSEQIQCKDGLCLEQKPLGWYGAQKLVCGGGACTATAYRFEPYQKLVLAFSDGSIRESNIFAQPKNFDTRFAVYVEKDRLIVENTDYKKGFLEGIRHEIWGALFITLVLELLAAFAYLFYTQKSFTVLYSVAVANVLTTLFMWTILARFITGLFLLWFFCFFAEALCIWAMNRKQLSFTQALQLSCTMNVTGYSLGMIFAFIFA